jgi:integrase
VDFFLRAVEAAMPRLKVVKPHSEPSIYKAKKDQIIWDDLIPQLGRRNREGKQTWIVQTRINGKSIRRSLGNAGGISLDRARILAEACLDALQLEHPNLSASTTIKHFAPLFFEQCKGRWKPATRGGHLANIKNQILPLLGAKKVSQVERNDVVKWFNQMDGAAGTRNRALAVLSDLMIHAEIVGLRSPGSNPCKGLRRHKSGFSAEYLDATDFAKLEQSLQTWGQDYSTEVAFVRFVAQTGCRRGEAEAACWHQLEQNRIILPDSKNGPKVIWLGKPTIKLLASLPRSQENIFVEEPYAQFKYRVNVVWQKVRADLSRPKVRIHDLRHSFASTAINMDIDLTIIGGLLGHADHETTEGYARLNERSVAKASKRLGAHFEKTLSAKSPLRRPTLHSKSIFKRFSHSKRSLPDFCKTEQLDPKQFRKELNEWRQALKQGATK